VETAYLQYRVLGSGSCCRQSVRDKKTHDYLIVIEIKKVRYYAIEGMGFSSVVGKIAEQNIQLLLSIASRKLCIRLK